MFHFKFADIGEGLHEGKVTNILVKIGDKVKDGDPLFEVETDKVTSEITSPIDGVIQEIKIKVDEVIHVGEVAFVIDDGSGSDAEYKSVSDQKESEKIISVSPNDNENSIVPNVSDFSKSFISPLAAKISQFENIDVSKIVGSGPNQRIMVRDLSQTTTPIVQNTADPVVVSGINVPIVNSSKRVKTSSLRQAIAKNLKESWNQVAYVSQIIEVDVTELVQLRTQHKQTILNATGINLTYLPFIAKAVCHSLMKHPIFGATYDAKTQEIVYPDTLNLGIAVDTENGLFVPNIKDAQTKSVLGLAAEIVELAKKAKEKKLTSQDNSNGHFTITNYGSAGAVFGTPVIKYPEIAILGTGTIIKRLNSKQQTRQLMYLTLAADHRWVDGVAMLQFLNDIKLFLENPSLLGIY